MFNITDTKVSNILLNITAVLTSEGCNYFESLEALSMSSSDRSSIVMTLSVAVPAAKRWITLNSIAEKLQEQTYAGSRRRYNITTEESKKPYRIDISLDYKGDDAKKVVRIIVKSSSGGSGGGANVTDIAESAQCLYASLAFNVYGRKLKDFTEEKIAAKDFVEAQKYIQVTSTLDEMTSLDPDWKKSSFNIANMLYTQFGGTKGEYQFHRGIGIDAIMPNGRTLQVASCHHYRDQWAKAFDVTYENLNAEQQHCHQTTYGMSERLLGAVVGMHGDDNGLIMPPAIAPHQVVICPMIRKNSEVDTIAKSEEVASVLRESGLRVKVDSRDIHAGQKYFDWEIKGVPLRLDIGPRDIENNTAFAARRTGGKEPLPLDSIAEECKRVLNEISDELRTRAKAHSENVVIPLTDLGNVDDGKIYEIAFDGTDAHAETIERTTGLSFLGDSTTPYDEEQPCLMSGKMTTRRVILAKTY